MKYKIARIVTLIVLMCPVMAIADTTSQNSQVTTIYAQLVVLLKTIAQLKKTPTSVLSYSPARGSVPLSVTFSIKNPDGTESILFGDGGYTGQTCTKKTNGWCDLSNPVTHTYQYSGTYTVVVYRHDENRVGTLVSTSSIVATN